MHTQHLSYPAVSGTKVGILSLSALSWCVLWLWGQGSYSAFLDHGDWTQAGLFRSLCVSIPGVSQTMAAALSVLTWILMVQGMMLPVSVKAFEQFVAAFARHPWFRIALFSFTLGYLLLSIIFGAILHGIGYGIGMFVDETGLFLFDGWIIGAAVFALAGLFQFSAAKIRFTSKSCQFDCTDTLSQRRLSGLIGSSVKSGLEHGFVCFMCCWAMMCLMFVFWTGSLVWMLCISALMLLERRSAELRAGAGGLLILAAFGVTIANLGLT